MIDDAFILDVARQNNRPVPRMRRPRDERDETFVSQLPEPSARARRRRTAPQLYMLRRDFTAASAWGSIISIVTLHLDREGRLGLDPHRSRLFTLQDREQEAVEAFYQDLQLFFFANGISGVSVRAGPLNGDYKASVMASKIEAIVQLVDMLDASIVLSSAVSSWVNRNELTLPEPQQILTPAQRKIQMSAIETAAYVECGGRNTASKCRFEELFRGR